MHIITEDPDGNGPLQGPADGVCSLRVADLDGDHDVDIIFVAAGNNRIAPYENMGGANPQFNPNLIVDDANWTRSVFAYDLDQDGDIDISSASSQGATIRWYENDGSIHPSFIPHDIDSNLINAIWTYIVDLNGDNRRILLL